MDLTKTKTYHVMTYGCQMNEHESEKIEGMLSVKGYKPITHPEEADVIVVNTCCIRESAEAKIISNIGFLKKYKREPESPVIIVCGCLTQQKDLAKKLFTRFRHVNIILGTQNLHRIPDYLEEALEHGKRTLAIEDDELKIYEGIPANRYNKPFAYVNVMYGCNNYCAYCIVPYVRGGERSRTPEKILNEINLLAKDGFKEITLLGQNVNSYGTGLETPITFAELLKEIETINGIERIRFMTSHPKDLSDELIDVFRTRKAVCNHIHLPVQAGSSKVLKLMNRKYDRERYLSLIEKLRDASPDIAITTDIIVGFPGETEADFLETLDLVERVQYDSAFTFKFSKRSGTKAENMPDQVDEKTKTDRIMRLIELQNEITYNKNKSLVGKTYRVLVEGKRDNGKQMYGKTDCFRLVNFETDKDLHGQFVDVKIVKAMKNSLLGELI